MTFWYGCLAPVASFMVVAVVFVGIVVFVCVRILIQTRYEFSMRTVVCLVVDVC